jgi:hypothetical protein
MMFDKLQFVASGRDIHDKLKFVGQLDLFPAAQQSRRVGFRSQVIEV